MSPVGTLAFVMDEEALLVRVSSGWQYVSVSHPLAICLSMTVCFGRNGQVKVMWFITGEIEKKNNYISTRSG